MQGRYEKIKPLGEGNYGKCYLAIDKTTGKRCVLKQVEILGMLEKEVAVAVKEAEILQALDHPFIIKFQRSFIGGDTLFIVMSYAQGGDLCQRIQQARTMNIQFGQQQILKWMTQLCLAVKHVHDRKIIHRDIKAQNVFLTKDGDVRLGDFGIARPLKLTMQKLKSVVGTPYYMSPQICEGHQYCFKTDIWSLGVIILEACLLRPPFEANSLAALALKISTATHLPVPPCYSPELRDLIDRMLKKNVQHRPSINQILQHPLLKQRIEGELSTPVRQSQFSHTTLHSINIFDKPKLPSRGLFLDMAEDSDSASEVNSAVSPKCQSQNVQGISKHLEGRKGEPKRKKQLRKREISEPNLTPKSYNPSEKRVVKNPSTYNLDKKKPKDAFKKKSKGISRKQIDGDRVMQSAKIEVSEISDIRDQIICLKEQSMENVTPQVLSLSSVVSPPLITPQFSRKPISSTELSRNDGSSCSPSQIDISVQAKVVNPRGFKAKRGRQVWKQQSVLQTLEGILHSRNYEGDLSDLYRNCQKNDGICLMGPCAGLVTMAYALKQQT